MKLRRPCKPGFTLLEVVAALGVGAITVALAATMLRSLWATDTQIQQALAIVEAEAQASIEMSGVFAMVLAPAPGQRTLHGDQQSIGIVTEARGAWGGLERRRVVLSLVRVGDSSRVVLRSDSEGAMETARVAGLATWQFLASDAGAIVWVNEWRAEGRLPIAVRLVYAADTLHFAVGGHR